MAKRFIDTTIWTQNKWFRKLDVKYKLIWFYLISNCDAVGVWEEDLELASFVVGENYDKKETLSNFNGRIKEINSGKKWWITDFCFFQYGELKEENESNKPHQSYIKQLRKHSLWIDYKKTIKSTIQSAKDKDKDKDKEKVLNKFFEILWKDYPRKDGKKEAIKHFNSSVETEEDCNNIEKALGNYKHFISVNKTEPQFIKKGSTWFNNWQDWIDYEIVSDKPKLVSPEEMKRRTEQRQREKGLI